MFLLLLVNKVTHNNGYGLAMWRHLKIVSPEPQPNRITNDEDNN
jgi:hypothetical protein